MKENESNEEPKTSVIQRLIKKRRLLEEDYMSFSRKRFKTAEDRRINDFNRLLTDGKKKEGK